MCALELYDIFNVKSSLEYRLYYIVCNTVYICPSDSDDATLQYVQLLIIATED